MALHGVGVDVADVGRFARLLEREGFGSRWFTAREAAECDASAEPAASYACRFAAKEAIWKSLGVRWDGPVPWRSIAVLTAGTRPVVALTGEVAAAAAAVGVGKITVTMSRSGDHAAAFALAE